MAAVTASILEARVTDEAAADLLVHGSYTSAGIAEALGLSRELVTVALRRLKKRGVPVVIVDYESETERRNRGSLSPIYRIVYPAGRTCSEPGCATVLRRTNPSDRCELHGGGTYVPEPLPEMHTLKVARRCSGWNREPHMTKEFGKHKSYCRACYAAYRRQYAARKRQVAS